MVNIYDIEGNLISGSMQCQLHSANNSAQYICIYNMRTLRPANKHGNIKP